MLRLLIEQREASVEALYRSQALNGAKKLNSHGLMGYRNEICNQIGLEFIPDQHAGKQPNAPQFVQCFFERFYTIETCISVLLGALNQTPRKIDYSSIVSFLSYNRPSLPRLAADAEEFLFHCFDLESGEFTRDAAAYLLWKFGVLKPREGIIVSYLEDSLFPALEPEELDEIRKSKDSLLSGEGFDNSPLAPASGDEFGYDMDEIRGSIENAANHQCD